MNKKEIIEMAMKAEFVSRGKPSEEESELFVCIDKDIYKFANLVAEKEREVVATWIMDKGFATGHGDSIVDLLDQLEWQIAEKEREKCANICEEMAVKDNLTNYYKVAANAIRAREQK